MKPGCRVGIVNHRVHSIGAWGSTRSGRDESKSPMARRPEITNCASTFLIAAHSNRTASSTTMAHLSRRTSHSGSIRVTRPLSPAINIKMQYQADHRFGAITLLGYNMDRDSARGGDDVYLTFFFRADQLPITNYNLISSILTTPFTRMATRRHLAIPNQSPRPRRCEHRAISLHALRRMIPLTNSHPLK